MGDLLMSQMPWEVCSVVVALSGPIFATVTPFQASGEIDSAALGDYLDLLAAAGVATILVNGTTGEFPSLSLRERIRVAEWCRERWSGTLVVHVGACAVGDALELAHHAGGFADALAVMNPFFFAGAPDAGVEDYFRSVLGSCSRPTLLYNFPHHTQTPISPRLIAQLRGEFPQLAGIKDSGKDRTMTEQYQQLGRGFVVFLGDDRAGARIDELGVAGVVTGAGGPVAELPVRIATAVAAGDAGGALAGQSEFDRYTDARKRLPISDIAFAKAAVAARLPGFPAQVRPPLVAASVDQMHGIHAVMDLLAPRLTAVGTGLSSTQ
ncbi:dihydrodipicolinate synthase family protein [Nocardia carnea]|uniref:dihydrodipicolinate synthase family protein n=1 Tax=Nocardia carnea TaxID=37328 RepID=UPI002454D969|nr:dihydrodipicolinate synthase family protein [Nocardia carnea]